jgi:dihydroorotate dehydrogenase
LLRAAIGRPPESLAVSALGLTFSNPLGLAAGFDKDAEMSPAVAALGFGFIEVGSVTLWPQPGNSKPRLFRLPEHRALINRMGFNSKGAEPMISELKRRDRTYPLGVNLGLNKECPKEQAPQQYAQLFRMLEPYGDYFVVNVSSPNTPGLRRLQDRLSLDAILSALQADNKHKRPVLVKIAPDLSDDDLDNVLDVVTRRAQGVIATNTTIDRPGMPADMPQRDGGLSGAPLLSLSTEMIRKIRARAGSKLTIIGVGGVFTGADALQKIRAGASLVQLYTGLVYRGPRAAVSILRELESLLRARGFKSVAEAVGTEERPS